MWGHSKYGKCDGGGVGREGERIRRNNKEFAGMGKKKSKRKCDGEGRVGCGGR